MSIPKLKKIKSEKKYHDLTLTDEYAWVDQPNILEVLKDANKLDLEVKDYISANNKIDISDYVLNNFNEDEKEKLISITNNILDCIPILIDKKLELFSSTVNNK